MCIIMRPAGPEVSIDSVSERNLPPILGLGLDAFDPDVARSQPFAQRHHDRDLRIRRAVSLVLTLNENRLG